MTRRMTRAMTPMRRWITVAPLLAALLLAACGEAVSDEHVIVDPGQYDEKTSRITMTAEASQRLDIQTMPIRTRDGLLVVPSSALLVLPDGTFQLYTNPESLVFVPEPISVDRDDGHLALLTDGPPAGTAVVTVGVPELYGIETGMGH